VNIKSMSNPVDVLQFMVDHSDSDTATHEKALRAVARLTTPDVYKDVVEDERFHTILASLASRLDTCDSRMLAMIADAAARFRTSTSELTELSQRLAEAVIQRQDSFNPRSLATIAQALAVRGVRDTATVEFIRQEVFKLMDELEPTQCIVVLEAFRRWGVFARDLVDLIVERMSDEVDRFTARDVVNGLAVVSRLGLARGFLLRRLCMLSFENLNQFEPKELTKMAYALAKLRFLDQSNIDDIAVAMSPSLDKLAASQVSEALYAMAMVDARHQVDFTRSLAEQYIALGKEGPKRSIGSLADFAWSLCSLELVGEFKDDFKATMDEIFDRSPPQNRLPLVKLFDVINAVELEHKNLKLSVPKAWQAACDDADRFEMDRLEASRLHNEIVMRFDHLRGMANGTRWQLRMLRNQPCGPYRVDLFDEESKIALDLEIVSWPTSRKLKHRLLTGLGFQLLRLDYWDWRRARTETEQNAYLEREINNLLSGGSQIEQ